MRDMISKTKVVFVLTAAMILASAVTFAMMSGGMMGGGSMMTSAGGFGMMGGTAGGPLVSADGTAYLTSMMPSTTPGTTPSSNSFVSHMMGISPSGQQLKLSVSGMMSKPVFANGITVDGITGNFAMATVSLPKMSDYFIMHNYGTTTVQSVLFWMQRPFTATSVPMAVSVDGGYASQPVMANNMIYVTTSNNGSAMMQGNDVFNKTFPSYTATSNASHLYAFKMDGTLVSKTVLQ